MPGKQEQTLSAKLKAVRDQRDVMCSVLKDLAAAPMTLDESSRVISELQFAKSDVNQAFWSALLAVSSSSKIAVSEQKEISSIREIPKNLYPDIRRIDKEEGPIAAVRFIRSRYTVSLKEAVDFVHAIRLP